MPIPPASSDGFFADWAHTVQSPLGRSGRNRKNTDPCVFGSTFKYCCCQQHLRNEKNPRRIRRLAPGSIILFGSKMSVGKFALDTVFVVGKEGIDYEATGDYGRLDVSDEYQELSLNCLAKKETNTFYRGQPYTPAAKMYSFTPARLFQEEDFSCGKRFVLEPKHFRQLNKLLPAGEKGFRELGAKSGRKNH